MNKHLYYFVKTLQGILHLIVWSISRADYVLVRLGCHNETQQTCWTSYTTDLCLLTILKNRRLPSRWCQGWWFYGVVFFPACRQHSPSDSMPAQLSWVFTERSLVFLCPAQGQWVYWTRVPYSFSFNPGYLIEDPFSRSIPLGLKVVVLTHNKRGY